MALDSTENWWTVGQIVGSLVGGIAIAFFTIYNKAKKERGGEDVVQKGIGAAFVDRSAAGDLRSIAEDTKKLREIAEDNEDRFKEAELLAKAVEKLKHKDQ